MLTMARAQVFPVVALLKRILFPQLEGDLAPVQSFSPMFPIMDPSQAPILQCPAAIIADIVLRLPLASSAALALACSELHHATEVGLLLSSKGILTYARTAFWVAHMLLVIHSTLLCGTHSA